jgi:antitoxin component YwqK of YwqJK toxin-antitoxin module
MKKLSLLAIFLIVSCAEEVKEINAEQLVERQGISYEVNSNTPFTGSTVKYYKNGQVKERRNYKDGINYDLFELYFENGQLEERGFIKNNKLDGLYKSFYANGQLAKKGNYIDDKKEGLWEEYWENGYVKERQKFKDGQMIFEGLTEKDLKIVDDRFLYEISSSQPFTGTVLNYNENGELQSVISFIDGIGHGLCKTLYANGQIHERYHLTPSGLDGYYEIFTKDGKLAAIYLYENNELVEKQETEYLEQYFNEF